MSIITGQAQILPGMYDEWSYLPDLEGKKVGVVANHTAVYNDIHLVDFLLEKQVEVKKVFAPEHGFRGKADAGAHVKDGLDKKTGLPIISLYGKNKKPSPSHLEGLDIVVFDIQDVGVRFYTYISTMSLVMEACAEQHIPVIILDRPNPLGYYVAGPVLKEGFESFVGMHKVPVVYGMTMGEYAEMVNGEGWLYEGVKCNLKVVKNSNYDHSSRYSLPIKPSPNLPNMTAIYLYPSLCLFEGTDVSVGRGTEEPFQQFGAPWLNLYSYVFVPEPNEGAKHPKHEGKTCYGKNLSQIEDISNHQFDITWLLETYSQSGDKDHFFNNFFDKLAGSDELQEQVKAGLSQEQIEKSWQADIEGFLKIRSKYLLYTVPK